MCIALSVAQNCQASMSVCCRHCCCQYRAPASRGRIARDCCCSSAHCCAHLFFSKNRLETESQHDCLHELDSADQTAFLHDFEHLVHSGHAQRRCNVLQHNKCCSIHLLARTECVFEAQIVSCYQQQLVPAQVLICVLGVVFQCLLQLSLGAAGQCRSLSAGGTLCSCMRAKRIISP